MIDALSSMNTYQMLLLMLVLLQALTSSAKPGNRPCVASSCCNIRNIIDPFRLKSDLEGRGNSKLELAWEGNHTVLYLDDDRYYAQSINYSECRIRLVNCRIHKGDCLSLPCHSPLSSNLENSYYWFDKQDWQHKACVVIVNCSKLVSSSFYIATCPSCTMGSYSSNTSSSWNLYALVNPKASDARDFCTIHSWTGLSNYSKDEEQINSSSYNYELIHDIMADGFSLSFGVPAEVTLEPDWTSSWTLGIYSIFMGQDCGPNIYSISPPFFCVFDSHSIFRGQVCGYKYCDGGTNRLAMKIYRSFV